jgi:hypothetical protein
MNELQRQLLNQPKVKVIAKVRENTANKIQLILFAFAFFNFFYFFSSTLWRALGG